MINHIQKAGLISGIGILIMVLTVPVAEFVIFPKLIAYDNAGATLKNISENRFLFTSGIFLHLMTLICDVVVAWSLYIFLRPTNRDFSLLTALFRWVFSALTLAALLNLVSVLNLVPKSTEGIALNDTRASEVLLAIKNFHLQWSFAFSFFGIYLILLGILTYKASYVPKIFGVLLMVAGFGYVVDTLGTFLFPLLKTDYLMITFFGELFFMLWLLVKGWRVEVSDDRSGYTMAHN